MKKINEKIKKALSFLLILTMAMTSVGVSTFSDSCANQESSKVDRSIVLPVAATDRSC